MPRKLLKRLLPHPDKIKKYPAMERLGYRIHDPNLWHLNRRSSASAVGIGLFAALAFIPVPGQMLLAAILAFYMRANLPISVLLVWISNPITISPLLYASYIVGSWLMLDPVMANTAPDFSLSLEWFQSEIFPLWKPLLLGCLVLGTISAAVGYFMVRFLWRWQVVKKWHARQGKRGQ
jgi:uncharacterized protein (DUF2062 family)